MSSVSPNQAQLETLAAQVGEALLARGETLATAESCTGGWIGQSLTAIAGSSAWFDRGFITYSNQAKTEELGVPEALLARVGAVSEPVAAAMAQGARRQGRITWAVAVSGIAGPGGGSRSKPVGTVCFAWAGPDQTLQVSTQHFPGNREEVRAQTVAHALTVLLDHLHRPLAA